jgi:glyoxalase family protein
MKTLSCSLLILQRDAPVPANGSTRGSRSIRAAADSRRASDLTASSWWCQTRTKLEERTLQLDGIHHITCITAAAPQNVDFYARVLGLRMVKKTVNFDAPDVYHLYYGDERGAPGSILTFFEFPDAAPGRAGAGMIHRLRWRVGSEQALSFWTERLQREGVTLDRDGDDRALRFRDPEGLGLELAVVQTEDQPLVARAEGIPAEHALLGFEGVRVYGAARERENELLTGAMGFTATAPGEYALQGGRRQATYGYDRPPAEGGRQGAGTVHHIAWCDRDEEHPLWGDAIRLAGARPTPIIDRQYFLSIYFRERSGVLFELATPSPGFAIDEDPEHLGEALRLPPQHEHLRDRLEATLTPLANPRARAARS